MYETVSETVSETVTLYRNSFAALSQLFRNSAVRALVTREPLSAIGRAHFGCARKPEFRKSCEHV